MDKNLEECLTLLPELLDFKELRDCYKSLILNEIKNAYNEQLSYMKLASNLYWLFHTPQDGDRVVKGQRGGDIYGTVFKDTDGQLKINLDEPLKTSKEKIINIRGGYNKIVDDSLLLNWHFIANNSLAYLRNNLQLIEYEKTSRIGPVYFVYHCDVPCKWCKKNKGKIVRLLPREMIENDIDDLSHYNIDDEHTQVAIWFNKNNIGRSKWRLCSFPHIEDESTCGFELLHIDLSSNEEEETERQMPGRELSEKHREILKENNFKFGTGEPMTPEQWERFEKSLEKNIQDVVHRMTGSVETKREDPQFKKKEKPYSKNNTKEWYNPQTGRVEKSQKKQKFIPQEIDYSYRSKEEIEYRKPVFIGDNLVRFNNNVYEAVSHDEYNKKLDEYRKDRSNPIPVDMKSTDYKQIFGEAEKNKNKG